MSSIPSKAKALALAQSTPLLALPSEGEALLTIEQVAAAYGVGAAQIWHWLKNDPTFTPKPVRKGIRFTRLRLTEVRAHMASLSNEATGHSEVLAGRRKLHKKPALDVVKPTTPTKPTRTKKATAQAEAA